MEGRPGGLVATGADLGAEPAGRTPWEREDAAFPVDLFRSWLECMTRPGEFFARVDPHAPVSRPLLFFLLFWILGSAAAALATDPALGLWSADLFAAAGRPPETAVRLFWFFLSPFVGLLGLGLNIAFVHLGVRLFVPSARPFPVTGRGLCYVAAPQVLVIVPFLGGLLMAIWSLVLAVVGMRELHGTTTGRAAAAVVVPQVLFWVFLIGTLFFFVVVAFTLATAAGGGG